MARESASPAAAKLREAVRRHRAGALDEAAALYAEALAIDPDNADALHLSGVVAHQRGRHDDAVDRIGRAIALAPHVPDFFNSRGLARREAGDGEGAESDFVRATSLNPDYVAAWVNLGATRLQRHRPADALKAFQRAAKLAPDAAEVQAYLGTAHLHADRLPPAVAALRRAVALEPSLAEAHYNLGLALDRSGDEAAAEAAWRRAIEANPFYLKPWNSLGLLCRRRGRADEARELFRRALSHATPDARDAAELWNNLANLLDDAGEVDKSLAAYEQAVGLAPDKPRLRLNLGTALLNVGRLEAARGHIAKARALDPGDPAAGSSDLFAGLFDLADPQVQRRAAETWAAGLGVTARPWPAGPDDPDRRLRVGYVSPNFHRHSVAFFIEPVLEAHDRGAVEVHCYAEVRHEDSITERLRRLADSWIDTTPLDDGRLVERIRADRIDVLIDLAGHTVGNRLRALARKPAPILATWLGYPATTGLAAVDWRITDALADPPGLTETHYTERLARLPEGFSVYRPPDDAPDVGPPPAAANGHVTFGSFNHAAKLVPAVLESWAALLRRLPTARLIVKHRGLASASVRAHYAAVFAQRGIALDRVDLTAFLDDPRGHLALYNRVDIALDPFPYNGTTTTCEALWMGVPVVALAGDTHLSRVGVSLLTRLGLADLAARDHDDYVAVACRLAGDPAKLAALRAGLRSRMGGSSLCDAAGFTRGLEAELRRWWRETLRAP